MEISNAILEKGKAISTATLHEAAGRRGALPSEIKPVEPSMHACGPALTVRPASGDNLPLHQAIYRALPGTVLVVDCGAGDEFGYWGEIMTVAAMQRGIAGLVITGGVRDSSRIAELGFAVFSGRLCIQGTAKDPLAGGEIGEPIQIGDVRIESGDLIVADADGVLALPAADAAAAMAAALQRDAEEEAIMTRLRAGATTLELYSLPPYKGDPATVSAVAKDDLVARLARLDACAISDALDRAECPGAALGLFALSSTRRIVGRAVTVQLGPADGRPATRHLCTAAVDASGPGAVIVIAHHGRTDVSGWGGVLSSAAAHRAVEGVVIDGACRDIDESRELDFPVYGRCTVPLTARGRIIEYDWNTPVDIAGISVSPGDLVIADGSGVVFIPQENAETIITVAESIAHKERLMVADTLAGRPVSEVMGTDYENLLKRGQGDG